MYYSDLIPESASYERPQWEPAGTLRTHPKDAPEQCFNAEKHGSPYFILTIRADIGDGRGREVSIRQGFQDGVRIHRPMSKLEPNSVEQMQDPRGFDDLSRLLRNFEYLIVKYEGTLGEK